MSRNDSTSDSPPDEGLYAAAEAALRRKRDEWIHRLDVIRADRRRESNPLERDWDDQAIQRENDETLDALDARGRRELKDVESALARIAAGTYGRCESCGEPVELARIEAEPTARTCVSCAQH